MNLRPQSIPHVHHMLGLYHGEPNAKAYKQIMAAGDVGALKEFIKKNK